MAAGINNLGQVVGSSTVGGTLRAFLWSPGIGMQDLGTIDGLDIAQANGINDSGQIIGTSGNYNIEHPSLFTMLLDAHAFVYTAATGMQDLGTLPGATASEAFRTSAGGVQTLGTLPGMTGSRCWRHKQQRTNRRALRYEPLRRPLPRACSRIRSALGYSLCCPLPGWHRHDKRNSRNDPDTFVFEGSRQHVRPGAMLLSAKACLRRLVNHRHASADRSMAPSVGISKPCHF